MQQGMENSSGQKLVQAEQFLCTRRGRQSWAVFGTNRGIFLHRGNIQLRTDFGRNCGIFVEQGRKPNGVATWQTRTVLCHNEGKAKFGRISGPIGDRFCGMGDLLFDREALVHRENKATTGRIHKKPLIFVEQGT